MLPDGYDDTERDQRYGRNLEHRSIATIRIEFQQRRHQRYAVSEHDLYNLHSLGQYIGGAAFHAINLTIVEPIVGLDYNPENLTLTRVSP